MLLRVYRVTISGHDVRILALTIYGEARGEPFPGKLGVGWVVRNRAENPGWWGGPSLADVCLHRWQFSCWNENDPNSGQLHRFGTDDLLEDAELRVCLRAALEVTSPSGVDISHGADHYVRTDWLTSAKLRPNWANGHDPVAEIGHHSFYRIGLSG